MRAATVVCERCGGCGGRFDATFIEGGCSACGGKGALIRRSPVRPLRCALLAAVPLAAVLAGPAVLGYGWGRLVAAVACLVAIGALGHEATS